MIQIKRGNEYVHTEHGKVTVTSVTSRIDPVSKKRKNIVIFNDKDGKTHTVTKYDFSKNCTSETESVTEQPLEKTEEQVNPTEKKQEKAPEEAKAKPQKKDEQKNDPVPWYEEKTCFVTTVIVNKFGLPDDCYYLEKMRQFRDGILNQTASGRELIEIYEEVGPTCAKIYADFSNDQCEVVFEILKDAVFLIEKKRYVSAMMLYAQILAGADLSILNQKIIKTLAAWVKEQTI